ncbi:MAG: hypothetical protein AAFV45_12200 [Pseudomonadota bacterium]
MISPLKSDRVGPAFGAAMGVFAAAVIAIAMLAMPLAKAAPGDEDDARFSMSPVDGGFIRLDKKTGSMSFCKSENGAWSCNPMDVAPDADAGAAAPSPTLSQSELDKLKAENEELKAEIRKMEEVFGLDGRKPPATGDDEGPLAGPPGGMPELKLPSEKDVDQAVDYLEGMIRKFRERFEDFGDKTDPDIPRKQDRAPNVEAPTPL